MFFIVYLREVMGMKEKWRLAVLCSCFFLPSLPVFAQVTLSSPPVTEPVVSQAAYDEMQRLADLGLVTLPAGCRDVRSSHFSRSEMTDLTLQALSRLDIDAYGHVEGQQETRRPGLKDALALRRELYKDLQNRGMIDDANLLTDLSPSSEATENKINEERKYKISGEIRYNYVHHSGDKPNWNWLDSRLRTRLYAEVRLNDDWHLFGMIEGNKHFLDSRRGRNDDWLSDKRLYVRGMATDDLAVTAGRYSLMVGDGNIFDSSIRGVTLDYRTNPEYEVTVGKTKAEGGIAGATIRQTTDKADYGAGVYRFDDDNWGTTGRTISHAWYNYHFTKHFLLGGMYLGTDRGDADGRHHGYVAKAVFGSDQTWRPGADQLEVYYYYQPEGTYVIHTMSGLADDMDGFRGLGLLYHHTLAENLIFSLEYYHLQELTSGDKNHTLWGDISYYF